MTHRKVHLWTSFGLKVQPKVLTYRLVTTLVSKKRGIKRYMPVDKQRPLHQNYISGSVETRDPRAGSNLLSSSAIDLPKLPEILNHCSICTIIYLTKGITMFSEQREKKGQNYVDQNFFPYLPCYLWPWPPSKPIVSPVGQSYWYKIYSNSDLLEVYSLLLRKYAELVWRRFRYCKIY